MAARLRAIETVSAPDADRACIGASPRTSSADEMKGQRFHRRVGFAVAGLRAAWRGEASFRAQARLRLAAAGVLAVMRPSAAWVALVLIAAALVLALEAANAALEALADALHPGHHPAIGRAKDLAAAAVLIGGLAAVGVGACLAYSVLP